MCLRSLFSAPGIFPQPLGKGALLYLAGSQSEHGFRCFFLAGLEHIAVQFKKQHSHHEPGPFIAVDERAVTDNPRCIQSGKVDHVRSIGVRIVLARTGKRGVQEAVIAQATSAAVQCQQAGMDGKRIALFDPKGLFHWLFREGVQRIAIARHDVLCLGHFLRELGIVRREAVFSIGFLDQKQWFSIAGLQALDHFLGQDDTERVAEFADLELNRRKLLIVITIVITFKARRSSLFSESG